eukprot:TRINITY_DN47304_c0_g1_i1.p1 TRINITY_DN47304_c0_g1~~TRINITY_DN47304_c0_g1_i1.p1  ORF type:complete len:300 (-),score=53.31 TRINITY_DN47304_c0_g1_i1:17-784(-)
MAEDARNGIIIDAPIAEIPDPDALRGAARTAPSNEGAKASRHVDKTAFNAFKGRWVRCEDLLPIATIFSGTLAWALDCAQPLVDISLSGKNSITMELDGATHEGTLDFDKPLLELTWSDGDRWQLAVPPESWDLISGTWVQKTGSEQKLLNTICRGIITWAESFNAGETDLEFINESTVMMVQGFDTHEGRVIVDPSTGLKRFEWSDGDVWEQRSGNLTVAPPVHDVKESSLAENSSTEAGAPIALASDISNDRI